MMQKVMPSKANESKRFTEQYNYNLWDVQLFIKILLDGPRSILNSNLLKP